MTPGRVICLVTAVMVVCVPGLGWNQIISGQTVPTSTGLPATIPLFPLEDVVLFPSMSRPLHIFESRYREMVADAVQGDGMIGMVLLRPGFETEYEGNPAVFSIGCAGEISDAEELPDGRWMIVLRGFVKFRIIREDQSRAYRVANVEAIPESFSEGDQVALREYRDRLSTVFTAMAPGAQAPPSNLTDEELVNGLSQFLELGPLVRQSLLESEGPLARSEMLLELVSELESENPK